MPTILHRLANWAESAPQEAAQKYKKSGTWKSISAQDFSDRVYYLALFLESRGLNADAATCIFSPNNPWWVHASLASLLVGARTAGIYPNSTAKDILYVLNHTEAKVLAVRDKEFFRKIVGDKGDAGLPESVELILVFDGDTSISPKAVAYDAAIGEGKRLSQVAGAKGLSDYLRALDPHAGKIMIYTSGTTGSPKGALLSHDNLVFTSDMVSRYWRLPKGNGSMFSFLPLCHVAETLQSIGVGISQRYLVSFCTKFENVATELPEVQPTLLLCVPRLWEKMMESVLNKVERAPKPRRLLAKWAMDVGARVAEAKYSKKLPNPLDLVQLKLADKIVLDKVRHAMGLGKATILASGAAALPAHVSRWFRCLGLEILEDFGQTETTGVICMTEPGVESAGTVGRGVPGIEVKIAEDGEILTRGRHIFKGYYKNPEATADALKEGWLHTGDLGEINAQGLIRIKGRKKEIMKTSGGKMIAPLPIEEQLKTASVISQACLVGDGRKYLSALLTLSESKLAEVKNMPGAIEGDVIVVPEVLREVGQVISNLNKSLASFEQIKRFALIARDFSIDEGEMTPTLKMKRNVIESRFKTVIDSLYN